MPFRVAISDEMHKLAIVEKSLPGSSHDVLSGGLYRRFSKTSAGPEPDNHAGRTNHRKRLAPRHNWPVSSHSDRALEVVARLLPLVARCLPSPLRFPSPGGYATIPNACSDFGRGFPPKVVHPGHLEIRPMRDTHL